MADKDFAPKQFDFKSQMTPMHLRAYNERRLLSVAIDYDMLMSMFNWNGGKRRIRLPLITGQLEGAYCIDVYHKPELRKFVAVFVHERFDVVADNAEPATFAPIAMDWRWLDTEALAVFLRMLPSDDFGTDPVLQ